MQRLGRRVYPLVLAMALPLLGSLPAWGQAQKMETVKVDLPPSPNFNIQHAPEQYPSGEMSVYGLRKRQNKYLDKDVQVKAYLIEIYQCPPEQRKCNDDLAAKAKKAAKKPQPAAATGAAPGKPGTAAPAPGPGGCRPCDQPHFYVADSPGTKVERAMLIADYPVKDDKGKPKDLVAKAGEQYIVTGTYSINSMTGFAASDGLIIHKRMADLTGKVIVEGNAVLPPEALEIKLEGRPVERLGSGSPEGAPPAGGGGPSPTGTAPKKAAKEL